MLSIKQGGMKNHFLSLWYGSTSEWTPVSRPIGEHYTQLKVLKYSYQTLIILFNTNHLFAHS